VLGKAEPLLEAPQLPERVSSERAVDLDRHERVALGQEPRADRVERRRVREEQHLERVWIRPQRLTDRFAESPVRRAAVGADQVLGRRNQTLRPREREGEDAAAIHVGARVGEPPRLRPHDRFEHHARSQCIPRVSATVGEENLKG